jgi:hypothetical protein
MKNILTFTILILTLNGFCFAQSLLADFNKAKEIKLLESTRKDVKRILADYKSDDEDFESFTAKNADIEISYSTDCSEEQDEEIAWNVAEGRVSYIEIYPNKPVKIENLGFSVANFQKEQIYFENEDEYIYSNKDFGIAFEVDENQVKKIILFPSNSYKSLLCENTEFKEFYSTKSWFGNTKLEERTYVTEGGPANVTDLTLSKNEINVEYDKSKSDKVYFLESGQIFVNTVAVDPEGDVLVYRYIVSAGKIVGSGAKVVWDLSGVKPGTYTITAGVDDGCGICGKTETKTVTIKNTPIVK